MPSQARFEAKDAAFSVQANTMLTYLTANKARLVITTAANANLTLLTTLITAPATGWNTIFPLSQNPATATSTIIANKVTLRDQIEPTFRALFADIPRSVLTGTDRDTLHIPLPSTARIPAAKPQEIPSLIVSERGHLTVVLNIVDSSKTSSNAKPAGVDAIEIESVFIPANSENANKLPSENDFRHLVTLGRGVYERHYTNDQLRGIEFLRGRYVNTRKEPGNWSEWISIIVS
jgi:hypothetical protein